VPREITRIEVPDPEPMHQTPDGGAETQGAAYRLSAPAVATEPLTVTAPDGTVLTWVPTELCYRDESGRMDYIVGSAPANVRARDREARYQRTFPMADDVFLAEAERVKHWVILHEPPRPPAEYLSGAIEFGITGVVSGVPLPEGRHCEIEAGPFRLPKPVARDLSGREIEGYYEVVPAEGGQQVFMWFPAAAALEAVYPVTIDPTILVDADDMGTWSHGAHLVAIAPNGDIYAVVRPNTNNVRVYRSADGGQTWTNIAFPGPSKTPYGIQDVMAAIAATPDGNIHLVIRYYHRPGTTNYDVIEYRRYTGTGWSSASIIDEFVRVNRIGLSMTVSPDGKLHVVYPGPNNEIRHAAYDGTTWSKSTVATGSAPYHPTIASDTYGRIMVVWVDNSPSDRVYFALRQGSSWSTPAQVYEAGSYQLVPFLVADGNNVFHLVCKQAGLPAHLRYVGSAWTEPVPVAGVGNAPIGDPVACVEWPVTLHVFWTDRTVSGQSRLAWNSFDGTQWGTTQSAAVGGTDLYTSTLYYPAVPPKVMARLPVVFTENKSGSGYNPTGYYAEARILLVNEPPHAPSLVDSVGAFDATQDVTLQWSFSDPDPADTQSAYQLVITRESDGAVVYDTGKVASTTTSHTIPGGTLANGQRYRWTVRVWDSADQAGPYAPERTLVTSARPVAIIMAPTQDDEIVADPVLLVKWSISDPESRGQSAYRLRLIDTDGATVLDSGQVADATARAYQLRDLQHGQRYTIELTVWDGDGVASDAATRTFITSFLPPPEPTATVEALEAWVRISIANNDAGAEVPVAGNDIYRRRVGETGNGIRIATGVPVDGVAYDYAVPSGVAYEYRVVAVGINGAPAASAWVAAPVLNLTGAWIHDPADPANTIRRFRVATDRSESWEPAAETLQFAGRKLPVAEFGEQTDQRVKTAIIVLSDSLADLHALRSLADRRTVLCYRDSAGRRIFGVLGPLNIRDERHGGYTVDLEITAVDYDEAV